MTISPSETMIPGKLYRLVIHDEIWFPPPSYLINLWRTWDHGDTHVNQLVGTLDQETPVLFLGCRGQNRPGCYYLELLLPNGILAYLCSPSKINPRYGFKPWMPPTL